jgi:hypothetical protein
VKAKIDGDLVYFNWADYLDPSVFKGFKEEYGVDIIESPVGRRLHGRRRPHRPRRRPRLPRQRLSSATHGG